MAIWDRVSGARRCVFVDGYIDEAWWQRQREHAISKRVRDPVGTVRAAFSLRARIVWWRASTNAISRLIPDARESKYTNGELLCLRPSGLDLVETVEQPLPDLVDEAGNDRYLALCMTFPVALGESLSPSTVLRRLPHVAKPIAAYRDPAGLDSFVSGLADRLSLLYRSPSLGASAYLREQGGLVHHDICKSISAGV